MKIPHLARMSVAKSYLMLLSAIFTASTGFELLREKQEEGAGAGVGVGVKKFTLPLPHLY